MGFTLRISHLVLAGLAVASLAACSAGQQQRIQASFDRNILDYTLGKPYTEIAQREAMTQEALFGTDYAYGNPFGASPLPGGDTLQRHVEVSAAMQTNTDIAGLFGSDGTRFDYRLFYFRVGPDGVIKDYANGVVSGQLIRCSYYIGGIFENCGNAELASTDMAQMDAAVTTSAGAPLSSWQ